MSCGKYLDQYLTSILIETGSGLGGGIDYGLKYGFKQIYSVEIDEKRYKSCKDKFAKNTNVNLSLGESIPWLKDLLSKIRCKCTFLLDAHIMSMDEVHSKEVCPIMYELELIIEHSKKLDLHHYILIDDAKLFSGNVQTFNNYTQMNILEVCKKTFPPYAMDHKGKYLLLS